jgi:hypothetical protein
MRASHRVQIGVSSHPIGVGVLKSTARNSPESGPQGAFSFSGDPG